MTKDETVRSLSLWQPWATLIANWHKRYETRTWRTAYRGPLLIHAGLKVDMGFAECVWAEGLLGDYDVRSLPRGAVVAVATLVDVRPAGFTLTLRERTFGDHSLGRWAWQLGDVQPLQEPVPCAGRQGLWTPQPEIIGAVVEQVGAL